MPSPISSQLAVIVWRLWRNRSIALLCALTLLMIAGIGDFLDDGKLAQAQGNQTQTPPPLQLIVVLDESGTMFEERNANSISASSLATSNGLPRLATDPNDRRIQAVIDLFARLASDTTASVPHQVGVITFGRTADSPVWLTGNSLIEIGAGSNNWGSLVGALRRPRGYGARPGTGDPVGALGAAISRLEQAAITSAGQHKPVILLITDDVPMDDFGNGPWVGITASGRWGDYLDDFEDPLAELSRQALYQGYCSSNTGGLTFAAYPMGAANWVNDDGSINTGGNGDYFQDLARRLNSAADASQWVYPIDPQFRADSVLRTDFFEANQALIDNLRCLWQPEPSRTGTTLAIPVSAFFDQFTVTTHLLDGAGTTRLIAPNGTTFEENAADSRAIVNDTVSGYKTVTWSVPRNTLPTDNWAGTWRYEVIGTTNILFHVAATLQVNEVRAQYVGTVPNLLAPGQDYEIVFQLVGNGITLNNDPLIGGVVGRLTGGSVNLPLLFERNSDGHYTFTISGTQVTTSGTYNLAITAQFADETELGTRILSLEPLVYGGSFQWGRPQPDTGDTWACVEGDNQNSQRFSIRPVVQDVNISTDSLGSYTQAQVVLAQTPIARLRFNRNSTQFEGWVDCGDLEAGDNQQVEVRGILPDGAYTPFPIVFNFRPTATPAPVVLAPTAMPSPTPTLPPREPIVNVIRQASTPPMRDVLLTLLALLLATLILRFTTLFYRTFLPLYNTWWEVQSRQDALSQPRRRLLGRLRRYVPFMQWYVVRLRHDLKDVVEDDIGKYQLRRWWPFLPWGRALNLPGQPLPDNVPLFRVSAPIGGQTLRIYAFVDLYVNNRRVTAGTPITIPDEIVRVEVEGQGTLYIFMNRTAKRKVGAQAV